MNMNKLVKSWRKLLDFSSITMMSSKLIFPSLKIRILFGGNNHLILFPSSLLTLPIDKIPSTLFISSHNANISSSTYTKYKICLITAAHLSKAKISIQLADSKSTYSISTI